jgi:hypothetical protein
VATGQPTQGTKQIDISKLQVVQDNTPRFRFSTIVDGQEAFLDYKVNEATKFVEIAYIWVPSEYREQGVAGLLLTRLHDLCKTRGLRCSPSTEARSYVTRWLAENPSYKDVCQVRHLRSLMSLTLTLTHPPVSRFPHSAEDRGATLRGTGAQAESGEGMRSV